MIDYNPISPATREAIDRWATTGRRAGGFVMAVLCNDLVGAVRRADEFNILALRSTVAYVYHKCPAPCWGSPEKVEAWAALFTIPPIEEATT